MQALNPDLVARPSAPIVFLHGDFGDGFDSWGSTCDLIGGRARSIVIDRPGVHEEIEPTTRFSFAGDASFVQTVATDLRLAAFHLVGHSYGALVALEVAAREQRRVLSLQLIEPPLLALRSTDPEVMAMDHHARQIQRGYWERGNEATTDAFFSMLGSADVTQRLRQTRGWEAFAAHAGRFARSEPAGDFPARRLEDLPHGVPVGLYSGGRSHSVLRTIARGIAKQIPGACLVEIADAGHAVQMAGPEFVTPLLELIAASASNRHS
jgi:pimeloyl-ACP methyl ester carboxylesterase